MVTSLYWKTETQYKLFASIASDEKFGYFLQEYTNALQHADIKTFKTYAKVGT